MSRLIVICGNAGTGKTTWARRVSTRCRAALLDLDTVSERLVIAAQRELGRDPNDRDSADYKRVFRDAVHQTLFAIARDCAGPVVIVAPFTKERSLPTFRDWLTNECERPAEVHYFVTEERVREERLRARAHPRDAAKFQDYASYRDLARDEPPPPYPHLWLDTTKSFPGDAELALVELDPPRPSR
jgi:predicted kinase